MLSVLVKNFVSNVPFIEEAKEENQSSLYDKRCWFKEICIGQNSDQLLGGKYRAMEAELTPKQVHAEC